MRYRDLRDLRDLAPKTLEELMEKNLSTVCPSCGDTITLIPQHQPINDSHDYSYFVANCPNFKRRFCKPIFAVYQALNDCIIETYPIPNFDASNLHDSIPISIREDYAESMRCLFVNAYKGAVTLCRRVIEAIACDKLGSKSKDTNGKTKKLYDLIDLLFNEGLITKDIKESAHEIRLFGNYGAHVQDDGLDSVEQNEAQDVKEITGQLLSIIYITPDKTKKLKEKRESK